MNHFRWLNILSFLSLSLFLASNGFTLTSTEDVYITDENEIINEVPDRITRRQLIWIKAGSRLNVKAPDNIANFGKLHLMAPQVRIDGTLNASGVGFSDKGAGRPVLISNKWSGAGGGGYGQMGGDGDNNNDSGGLPYDTTNAVEPGSHGGNASITAGAGRAGGSIRIDALVLTLTASAQLLAAGNSNRDKGVGGGSGGGVLLNGVYMQLEAGSGIDVSGGPGGPASVNNKPGAGGGGSGGRIKWVDHHAIINQGIVQKLNGGTGGNTSAGQGQNGEYQLIPAPTPTRPNLSSPANGQTEVGQYPTFEFSASDGGVSQFLQYKFVILNNAMQEVFSASQLISDLGWSKPYYASGEPVSFIIPLGLFVNQTYYWKVEVTNNAGKTWTASTVSSFSTVSASNPQPLPPQPVFPQDDMDLIGKTPSFQIFGADPADDTLHFTLMLAKDASLTNPRLFESTYAGWNQSAYPVSASAGVTATCQILNTAGSPDALIPGTDYYWKAIVTDRSLQSAGSAVYHFRTAPVPGAPAVVTPADGAMITTKTPRFEIISQNPAGSALEYKIELSADAFQTVLQFRSVNGEGWTQSSYAAGVAAVLNIPLNAALHAGETYVWHALAYDRVQDNWSPVGLDCSFTVLTPPLLPTLLYPGHQASIPGVPCTFQFAVASESGSTLNGRMEISADQFQTMLYCFDQTQDPEGWSRPVYASSETMAYTLPATVDLRRGQTYWWRAQATDGVSWSPYAEAQSFHVAEQLEIQQVQTAPNPAVGVSQVQIRFQSSADADLVIRFYNQRGQLLDTFPYPAKGGPQGNLIQYSIARYASGVYYYVVEARSGLGTQKITKRFAVVK